MNRRWIYVVSATLMLVALEALRARDMQRREAVASQRDEVSFSGKAPTSAASPAQVASSPPPSGKIDEAHKKGVRAGLEAIVEGLKQIGTRNVPAIAKTLRKAMATDDPGVKLRAFHEAIYGRFAQMREAISAIMPYLESPDPYVRYLAAEALLRVGDQSGVKAMLALVQSDEAVLIGTGDLRFAAAATLGAFNITEAADSIRDLYSRTKEGELLRSLASLGVQANEAGGWKYVPSPLAIENYAKVGSTRFVPQIASTFDKSSDPATKNAAAWALARMTGEGQYVEYLSEVARPAIESEKQTSYNASTEALRYLGSIQSPEAVKVLEQALDSHNPIAVQYATVNLLFNQPGGSKKAEQLVIRELETSPRILGTELVMQIASKSDNRGIRAAAHSLAQRTASDRWRYWGIERSKWPVQNWIYDYAVTLNP